MKNFIALFLFILISSCGNKIAVVPKNIDRKMIYNVAAHSISNGMLNLDYNIQMTPLSSPEIENNMKLGYFVAKNLPTGLVVNIATGEISGIPIEIGVFNSVLIGKKNIGAAQKYVYEITISVSNSLLEVLPDNLLYPTPNNILGNVLQTISPLSVDGTSLVYTSTSLPPGCVLSSTTGLISCNHLGNGGDYRSTIRATNSLGYTEATIDISIGCSALYTNVSGICVLASRSKSCVISNGVGTQSTSDGGYNWTACAVSSCDINYSQVSNACVASIQTRSCSILNGTGTQSTSDGGVVWDSCVVASCDAFYTNISNSCVSATTTQVCTIANGIGSQGSVDGGANWGTCTVVSCDSTYTNNSNVCVLSSQSRSCSILNGTGTQSTSDGGFNWTSCSVVSCDANYSQISNICELSLQTRSCAVTNGAGTQSTSNGGANWGACTVVSCDLTYANVSNSCVVASQTQACSVANGTGTQSSVDGGVIWNACTVASCNSTYTNVSNSCVLENQDRSCAVTNGTGIQSTSDGGVTWNACTVSSCDTHYSNVSNSCTLNTYSLTINKGTGVGNVTDITLGKISCGLNCTSETKSYDSGSLINLDITLDVKYSITGWTGCSSTSLSESRCTISAINLNTIVSPTIICSSNYIDVSGDCVLKNQNRSCSVTNGTGTQSTSDGGVIWTSCSVSSCDTNYSNVSNSCVLSSQNRSCSITNGTGTQSTSDGGVVWTACSVSSCDTNYSNVSNACVLSSQTRACSITNGTGTQSTSDGGVVWGTCTVVSCDTNYSNVSNTCVLSSQTRACASQPTNSTGGTESTSNGGLNWTACSSFTCNANYILNAGSTACESKLISRVLNFSTSTANSCGIDSSSAAYCWGWNGDGNNGNNGTNTDEPTSPVAVYTSGVLSGKTVTQISVGDAHVCAVASGKAYCWGKNSNGQLGNNLTSTSMVPVAVNTSGVLSGKNIVFVDAGASFSCALTDEAKVYCWGLNSSGQLGNASTTQSLVPVAIDTSGTSSLNGRTVLQLTVNKSAACVVTDDYNGHCWGSNANKELGANLNTSYQSSPVAVYTSGVLSGKTLRTISGHNDDTFCAIASDNNAYCWGHGGDGQLGNSTWVNSKVAVAVDKASGVLSGLTIKSISAGYRHTCALSSNNTIACWGRGGNGQLGDGGTSASPTPVNTVMYGVLSGKTVTNIVTGWYQSCAKTTENKFYCWGWNDSAQLGVGNFTQYELPVLSVPGFTF